MGYLNNIIMIIIIYDLFIIVTILGLFIVF